MSLIIEWCQFQCFKNDSKFSEEQRNVLPHFKILRVFNWCRINEDVKFMEIIPPINLSLSYPVD